MRYPRSSYNDEALAQYSSDCRDLLQGGITADRVFWLKGIIITNADPTSTDYVVLYDGDTEGAEDAGPVEDDRRLLIAVGPKETVALEFPGPGIKFVDGVLAATLFSAADGGVFKAYGVTITGYEE